VAGSDKVDDLVTGNDNKSGAEEMFFAYVLAEKCFVFIGEL
jgi:hypothetical protein